MAMTTKETLSRWFDEGLRQGATHLIVVCDTFSYDDYPVYVKPGEDPRKIETKYSGNMQRVMEVYALHLDKKSQMRERRSFHYEIPGDTND